jgi:hypothetical protein
MRWTLIQSSGTFSYGIYLVTIITIVAEPHYFNAAAVLSKIFDAVPALAAVSYLSK